MALGNALFVLHVLLASFIHFSTSRAVNISNTWMLPEEGFPVFYRYFRDRISWYEADAVCQFHHSYLVTAESTSQYDAIRAYLKELDVTDNVWIGLSKNAEKPNFTWTNNLQPISGEGHWQESIPLSQNPLCVAMDPAKDFLWKSLTCGGPEVASFICEMPIPTWAMGPKGCLLTELPSLTVLYIPEQSSLELTSDCGLDGTKRIACKGNADREEILKQLTCAISIEDFEDKSGKSLSSSPTVPYTQSESKTTKIWTSNTVDVDYGMPTRHRRETEDTLSASSTESTGKSTPAPDIFTVATNYDTEITTNAAYNPSILRSIIFNTKASTMLTTTLTSSGSSASKFTTTENVTPIIESADTITTVVNVESTLETKVSKPEEKDIVIEYPSAISQGQLFSIIENGTMFDIIQLNETSDPKLVQEMPTPKPSTKLQELDERKTKKLSDPKTKPSSKKDIYKNTDPKKKNLQTPKSTELKTDQQIENKETTKTMNDDSSIIKKLQQKATIKIINQRKHEETKNIKLISKKELDFNEQLSIEHPNEEAQKNGNILTHDNTPKTPLQSINLEIDDKENLKPKEKRNLREDENQDNGSNNNSKEIEKLAEYGYQNTETSVNNAVGQREIAKNQEKNDKRNNQPAENNNTETDIFKSTNEIKISTENDKRDENIIKDTEEKTKPTDNTNRFEKTSKDDNKIVENDQEKHNIENTKEIKKLNDDDNKEKDTVVRESVENRREKLANKEEVKKPKDCNDGDKETQEESKDAILKKKSSENVAQITDKTVKLVENTEKQEETDSGEELDLNKQIELLPIKELGEEVKKEIEEESEEKKESIEEMDLNKEIEIFPVTHDKSQHLNRTFRKELPLMTEDDPIMGENKLELMDFEEFDEKKEENDTKIDPNIDALNKNLKKNNDSETFKEIFKKQFLPKLLQGEKEVNKPVEEKEKKETSVEAMRESEENENHPKPNRQRQLTRPHGRPFYPNFFSRVLG